MLGRSYVLGLDLGTSLGACMVFVDAEISASTHKLKNDLQGRVSGVAGVIRRHASADCLGVCIEEPFSGQFSSVKALFPMPGDAVLACEQEGLPWSTATWPS